MALDLNEIITSGRDVRTYSTEIVRIAQQIKSGVNGVPLHADTKVTLKAKAIVAKGNYLIASAAFEAAIGS